MARLIVILLIALLPLRGWSATGMAIQMALTENGSMASSMESSQGVMPADCPMLKMDAATVGEPSRSADQSMDGTSHKGCQACQLCMSLTVLDFWPTQLPEPSPLGPALALTDWYSSAELFEDSKPPIS